MSAAAVIAMRRRRLVRRFRDAGATDPEHAGTLEALGERQTWGFDRMMGAGVFLAAPDGRYFMDEAAATDYRHRCREFGVRIWREAPTMIAESPACFARRVSGLNRFLYR